MVFNGIVTRFFKLDEKRALQVEFHRIGSNSKPGPKNWLKDDKLSEIKTLLHNVIQQCVSDTGKTEKKTEHSNQIITGNTVKLGCVFKKSLSHDVLLGEDSDDESPYRSLYGQKLIVYVCPIEPGSPNNGSELYRAMVRADSGSTGKKMVKISSYFSKAGGSGTQGSSTGTAQTTSSASSSSSQDQKEVIRNIMKRGKMAKQSKKVKSSARKKEEQIKPKQQEKTSQNTSDQLQKEDTTPDANIADHKEKTTSSDDNITQSINNPTNTNLSLSSDVIDITSYKCDNSEFMSDATVSKGRNKNQTDNLNQKQDSMASENIGVTHGISSVGTITLCDVSLSAAQDFQPSDEPTITVYSAEQIQDLKLAVKPLACHPDPSIKVNRTSPVPTTNPSTSEEVLELGDDSNDSILPSYSFVDQNTDSRPDDNSDLENKNSDVDSDTLFDRFSDTHVDLDSIRAVTSDSDSSSDDSFPVLTKTQRRQSTYKVFEKRVNRSTLDDSVDDSDSGACLLALKHRMTKKRVLPNFPSETKSDEEIPNKKLKYDSEIKSSKTNNETFDSDVETPDTLKSTSVIELPSLMRSRNSKMSRAQKELKQATLSFKGGNLAVTKTQDSQPCAPEKDRFDCIIMEDQASQRLRSDLRREVIHAESVKDLNEQHVRFLVQENRRYLKDIFEGKIPCERHKQYKQGGRTRNRLNYQVYLGLFTDEQQDVVMETLMSIFCKKNHGFLDYVMKVILPEVLIKIYMEVTGLSHDEVDNIMARGGS